jgi:cytoskeletal protein CcmA (bactofilin family)
MLKRSKKDENDQSYVGGKIMEEKIAPSPLSPTSGQEQTIIGEHIAIEGSIRGEENLLIEGSMKGNVEMQKYNFAVGSKGRVNGEIHAQNVNIKGELKGNINALGKVEITSEADFYGEIKAKSISVEDGAYFKGVIELDREPHRKPAGVQKPLDQKLAGSVKEPVSQAVDIKKET